MMKPITDCCRLLTEVGCNFCVFIMAQKKKSVCVGQEILRHALGLRCCFPCLGNF